LPIGGHIELNENPEQALEREIKEECGLSVEIVGDRPAFVADGTQSLIAPRFLNIHEITKEHRHVALIYFGTSKNEKFVLNADEHNALRWFSREELAEKEFVIRPEVCFYAEKAIEELAV